MCGKSHISHDDFGSPPNLQEIKVVEILELRDEKRVCLRARGAEQGEMITKAGGSLQQILT